MKEYFLAEITDSIGTVTYELVKAIDKVEAFDKVAGIYGYEFNVYIQDTIE